MILPKILDIPPKLLPVIERFDAYRYFLLKGGRGGGKSQSIARFILYLTEKYKIRVVCGRETQNSIAESVYSLFADLIRADNLNFDISSQKIVSRETGSPITFRGFREQGAFNIQGMEGVDILWIDESQALTKQTLDVLIPTIRKDTAKIFFTMNPHLFNDPVVMQFSNRSDCLVININFDENPHCTNALKKEAEECRKLNEKDYNHIWLGYPLDQSEDGVYSLEELLRSKANHHEMPEGYGMRVAGFDIARYGDDKTAAVILQQMGALHWEEVYCEEWDNRDLNYTTGRILMICNEQNVSWAAIDEDGIGSGPFDTLTKGRSLDYFLGFRNPTIAYSENKDYANNRTLNAYKLKKLLVQNHICIKDRGLIEELQTIKYTFDHNQRRILVSKEKMRKDGIKSPNKADALIMAVSLIGNVQQKQQEQYQPRTSSYSKEDNILGIAGIR